MRALVVEGGSMRAAYANGVLAAFEAGGFDGFDAVYGTSAGAALAAWYTARQARFAARTWDLAADRDFLSYRRWILGRGPLLDHDHLFRTLYERELDVPAIRRAPHRVVATVTDADTGEVLYPDVRHGPTIDWVKASGRMPLACGPPVEIEGRRLVDGGVGDPIPIARAIADGATDVVLLLNRPAGLRRPEPFVAVDLVGRRFPNLREHVRAHHRHHNEAVHIAERPPAGVRVRIVRPARDLGVGRFTRDLASIHAALARGEEDGRAFLAREAPRSSSPLR